MHDILLLAESLDDPDTGVVWLAGVIPVRVIQNVHRYEQILLNLENPNITRMVAEPLLVYG